MTNDKTEKPNIATKATEKVLAALNRADEIGGEVRDFLTDKVAVDPRYVSARKKIAKLFGREFISKDEEAQKRAAAEQARAKVAATAPVAKADPMKVGFGDASIKAQVFGKKSCPWSGRAITVLERNKVDFDWVDLEEPEHEEKLLMLSLETKQNTVPFVYLRGHFIGGFNALAEVERLGQLEVAMMTPEERAKQPMKIEIVARPNTDEIAPADQSPE